MVMWVDEYYSGMDWYGDGYTHDDSSYSAFTVSYYFETISWSYLSDGWVGGDADSVLRVEVANNFPGYEYRLRAYYMVTTLVNIQE